ncbi:MAG: filamentous hemagglutinin N-terminal domain-containing protein [Cyanobacteria bacterium P01_D01_bin.156]
MFNRVWLVLVQGFSFAWLGLMLPAVAQLISPENGDLTTGTQVNQADDTYDITGGELSGDGANLFHNFDQFTLLKDQTVNFITDSEVQNVLSGVLGGASSFIDGTLQVSGSSANLYFLNPAGIVFGENAALNLDGAFTATTATGLGFGDNIFNLLETNAYSQLVDNPTSLIFSEEESKLVVNTAKLKNDESITLVGGAVINSSDTGTIETVRGNVNIATVHGEGLVRISQEGNLLSLIVPSLEESILRDDDQVFRPLDLPGLLTNGADVLQRLEFTVQNEQVYLANSEDVISSDNTSAPFANITINEITSGGDTFISSAGQIVIWNNINNNGGLVELVAQGNITGGIITNVARGDITSEELLTKGVFLRSLAGDIQIDGIDSEPGIIEINAAGLFRATGKIEATFDDFIRPDERAGLPRLDIDEPENIDIRNFLISENLLIPDGNAPPTLNREFVDENGYVFVDINNDTVPLTSVNSETRKLSLIVFEDSEVERRRLIRQDISGVPVSILARTPDFGIDPDDSRIQITHSGENFIVGPEAVTPEDGFSFNVYDGLIDGVFAVTQEFSLVEVDPDNFPENASGTAGSIVIGIGGNGYIESFVSGIEYDLVNPVDPIDPGNPVEPVNPVDPVTPDNPVNPSNPVNSPETANSDGLEDSIVLSATLPTDNIGGLEDPEDTEEDFVEEREIESSVNDEMCSAFISTDILSVAEVLPEECQ